MTADPFYTLTVSLHAYQANFRFCFLSKANAEAAYASLKRPFQNPLNLEPLTGVEDHDDVEVQDDYGNLATIDRKLVMCMVLTDAIKNGNADIMASFLQQKATLKLNKMLMADTDIRAAQSIAMPRNVMQS